MIFVYLFMLSSDFLHGQGSRSLKAADGQRFANGVLCPNWITHWHLLHLLGTCLALPTVHNARAASYRTQMSKHPGLASFAAAVTSSSALLSHCDLPRNLLQYLAILFSFRQPFSPSLHLNHLTHLMDFDGAGLAVSQPPASKAQVLSSRSGFTLDHH